MQVSFWNDHYKNFRVQEPSEFSKFCVGRYLKSDDQLVELGCGNGRDGVMLTKHVARYTGMDACPIAIDSFSKNIADGQAGVDPERVNLKCEDFTAADFGSLATAPTRLAIYSRFSLHSINYAEADRLFTSVEKIAGTHWIFMLEARTIYDELYGVGKNVGRHEFQTDHYRRFIDPVEFLGQLAAKFAVKYFEVANGFARFGDQDPLTLRAVFGAKSTSLKAL